MKGDVPLGPVDVGLFGTETVMAEEASMLHGVSLCSAAVEMQSNLR